MQMQNVILKKDLSILDFELCILNFELLFPYPFLSSAARRAALKI